MYTCEKFCYFYVHVNGELLLYGGKWRVSNCISVMRDMVEHPTSFIEASQKKRSSKSWAII